jgi:hypothetical protein
LTPSAERLPLLTAPADKPTTAAPAAKKAPPPSPMLDPRFALPCSVGEGGKVGRRGRGGREGGGGDAGRNSNCKSKTGSRAQLDPVSKYRLKQTQEQKIYKDQKQRLIVMSCYRSIVLCFYCVGQFRASRLYLCRVSTMIHRLTNDRAEY